MADSNLKKLILSELVGFGPGIAELRRKLGISQQQMADEIGVCERTMRKYENNELFPPLDLALSICYKLEIPIDELIIYDPGLRTKWAVKGVNTEKKTLRSDEEILEEVRVKLRYNSLKIGFYEEEVKRLQKIIDD